MCCYNVLFVLAEDPQSSDDGKSFNHFPPRKEDLLNLQSSSANEPATVTEKKRSLHNDNLGDYQKLKSSSSDSNSADDLMGTRE